VPATNYYLQPSDGRQGVCPFELSVVTFCSGGVNVTVKLLECAVFGHRASLGCQRGRVVAQYCRGQIDGSVVIGDLCTPLHMDMRPVATWATVRASGSRVTDRDEWN
jgi:hypothetical protein